MEWQIFYGDGSSFSSEDGDPCDAPGRGVVAIACPDPIARWVVCSKFDYYIWREDGWYGVDIFGLFDYLIDPGFKVVKMGRTVPNQDFQDIHQRAADLKKELLNV